MSTNIKSKIPFVFLVMISVWWGFYYSGHNALNDFGQANYEWLFLIDALFVLPLVCFFCVKDKKDAALKAVLLCCLAIFIGSMIIPEQSKHIWPYLENGRYVLLAIVILLEVFAIFTVYTAISVAVRGGRDPDIAISNAVKKLFGDTFLADVFSLETRMWLFALFSGRVVNESYTGDTHFFYDKKDGARSNQLGFILLILLEIPLMHLLLHFTWSPLAANIISLLTVAGLVFFIAEYRATAKRPISLSEGTLIVRYGLYQPFLLPVNNIKTMRSNNKFIKRSRAIKRYNYSGVPNVIIRLEEPVNGIDTVYIGVNSPDDFIAAVTALR